MNPELELKWQRLLQHLQNMLGKTPDLNAILFLVGVQELGKGPSYYTKEQKQELMHVAVCTLLSKLGYYIHIGNDSEGWPHYELNHKLPILKLNEQEELLKIQIIDYFETYF